MNPDQRSLHRLRDDPHLAPMPMDGSPMAKALGAQLLDVDAAQSRVTVSFQPGPVFTQAAGVVQGGAVATMLDFVLAYAALLAVAEGQSVATATLHISFLRPALTGRLQAMGWVERAGRGMVFARGELKDAEGRSVATASAALPVVAWRTTPKTGDAHD